LFTQLFEFLLKAVLQNERKTICAFGTLDAVEKLSGFIEARVRNFPVGSSETDFSGFCLLSDPALRQT
jgi:hypothetical protein